MNKRLAPLPPAISQELDVLAVQTGEHRKAENGEALGNSLEEAWNLLPEPKAEWDYYPQVTALAAVSLLPKFGQCENIDPWLERLYATHFDLERRSEYTNLLAGHALMQCARKNEAVALFKQVHLEHGPQWFIGEYAPYLNFAEGN